MKKTTMLRSLLKEPGVLPLPVAYDCISARIAETVGFKAISIPASTAGEAQLGLSAVGLATASDVENWGKRIANSVNIPVILSADDGFGSALAAYRTTEEVIRMGAAGIIISDRKPGILAKTPHNLLDVLSLEEYLGKMGAVVEARNREDKDFIIIASLDAGVQVGDEDVIIRSKACVKLGVDVIFPHHRPLGLKKGVSDKEILMKLFKKMGAPEVLIWGVGPNNFTIKDYDEVGAKIYVPFALPIVAVKETLFEVYQDLFDKGFYIRDVKRNGAYSNKIRGMGFWLELENKYIPQ